MKNTEDLTSDEIEFVFGVLMDSEKQEKLLNGENPENAWSLDYVYDSKLRKELEKENEVRNLSKELNIKNTEKKNIKI